MQILNKRIEFKQITVDDLAVYRKYYPDEYAKGCEFSFANLFLWGRQSMAEVCGNLIVFSQFDRRSVYPFPIGEEDKKQALDAIIADSEERGIPCRITGMSPEARELLESLYPSRFSFHCDEGSFDYVYNIDDLADLKGKKYHGKRNHIYRFEEEHPGCVAKPIDESNIEAVRAMAGEWFDRRIAENPDSDFHMERIALDKAFRYYRELSMEGLALIDGGRVLAFTLASRMTDDTFDVHFEKALPDVNGAYPAINRALARHIRDKYPSVKYLNREDDMGLEGLRRAKKSYHPALMIRKYWAHLMEVGYEY